MGKAAILFDQAWRLASVSGTSSPVQPWTQLLDPQPRHRAVVNATSCFFILDLLSVAPRDLFGLVCTTLTGAESVQLRASATDPTVTTSLLHNTTIASQTASKWYGNHWRLLSSPISVRYVRWDISGAAAPIGIGVPPCGLLFRPGRNHSLRRQRGRNDLSVRDVNVDTGTHHGLVGPAPRAWRVTFPGMTATEIDTTMEDADRDVTLARDVAFVPDTDMTVAQLAQFAIWGAWKEPGALGDQQFLPVIGRQFSLIERL